MSEILRVLLIICSIGVFILCIKKMREAKLKATDCVMWMIGCIILILMSIFFNGVTWISAKLGFMAPVNFVFFIMIAFLLIFIFMQSIKIYVLEDKLKDIDHYLALKKYDENKNEK